MVQLLVLLLVAVELSLAHVTSSPHVNSTRRDDEGALMQMKGRANAEATNGFESRDSIVEGVESPDSIAKIASLAQSNTTRVGGDTSCNNPFFASHCDVIKPLLRDMGTDRRRCTDRRRRYSGFECHKRPDRRRDTYHRQACVDRRRRETHRRRRMQFDNRRRRAWGSADCGGPTGCINARSTGSMMHGVLCVCNAGYTTTFRLGPYQKVPNSCKPYGVSLHCLQPLPQHERTTGGNCVACNPGYFLKNSMGYQNQCLGYSATSSVNHCQEHILQEDRRQNGHNCKRCRPGYGKSQYGGICSLLSAVANEPGKEEVETTYHCEGTRTQEEEVFSAYWEYGNCGHFGNDYNANNWCGNSITKTFACPEELLPKQGQDYITFDPAGASKYSGSTASIKCKKAQRVHYIKSPSYVSTGFADHNYENAITLKKCDADCKYIWHAQYKCVDYA